MLRLWQDRPQGRRITRRLIRGHLDWRDFRLIDGTAKKGLGRLTIAPLREIRIDDLTVLVNRPLDVGPVVACILDSGGLPSHIIS